MCINGNFNHMIIHTCIIFRASLASLCQASQDGQKSGTWELLRNFGNSKNCFLVIIQLSSSRTNQTLLNQFHSVSFLITLRDFSNTPPEKCCSIKHESAKGRVCVGLHCFLHYSQARHYTVNTEGLKESRNKLNCKNTAKS